MEPFHALGNTQSFDPSPIVLGRRSSSAFAESGYIPFSNELIFEDHIYYSTSKGTAYI